MDGSFEAFFTKHKRIILVIFIFIMAFAIRGHLLKYDYMFEFDTYFHLRMTEYALEGNLPDYDPLGFYAQGGSAVHARPPFLWYFVAFLYVLFTFGSELNRELLMQFARVLPAIFGALISVAMYFLGKEIYNRKAGFVMAIVAATIPAFVYRTMAGFYENDSLGHLWLVIGFIFLVKALKNLNATKKHLRYAILAGFFFGLMAFTWDVFLLIPLVLVGYFISSMVYMAYKNVSNKQMASFFKIFMITFIIFVALASIAKPTWVQETKSYVVNYIPINQENIDRIHNRGLAETDVLSVSVGEENVGKKFFLYKYSFLTWIPFLVVLLMPLYLLFSKKRDYFTLLLFFWLAITLFMAWSKLKFTFTLGLPIAAATGFLFYFLDEKIRNKKLWMKRSIAILFAIILLSSIAAGTHEVFTKKPHFVEFDDWRESIFWIVDNTSEDAKIFNWWDFGHWLTYFTQRKVSSDNTNARMEANSDFGLFVLSEDINFTKDLMRKYDSDYVIIDNKYFNRYASFGSYGYLTINFQDPRITRYVSFVSDCHTGFLDEERAYKCGENILTETEFKEIPDTWVDFPTTVISAQGNQVPIYLYRLENPAKLVFLNENANNTTFAKIWFGEEEHKEIFSLVYENRDVRIYKVNKDNLN